MNYEIIIRLKDQISNELSRIRDSLREIRDTRVNLGLNTRNVRNQVRDSLRGVEPSVTVGADTRNIPQDVNNRLRNTRGEIPVGANTRGLRDQVNDSLNGVNGNIPLRLGNFERVRRQLDSIKGQLLAIGGVVATLAVPIKQSMDFELQFVDVAKVFNGTDQELANIKKMIFDIAKTSSASVADITKVTAEGIATGKIPLDDMREYVKLANEAKVAFEVTNDQLGKAMNASLAKLGFTVKETKELYDMLNYSTNISSSKMVDMLNVLSRTAGSLKGMQRGEMATIINFAVEKGVSPELTASSMNTIFNKLKALNEETVKKLKNKKGLEIELPMSISGAVAFDEGKGFQYLYEMLKQVKKETDADKRFSILSNIFGRGEQINMLNNFLNDMEGFKKRYEMIANPDNYKNSVSREFANVEATAIKKIEKFKGLLNILAIKIGDTLLSVVGSILSFINPIVAKITEFVKANQPLVGIIMKIIGAIALLGTAFITVKLIFFSLAFVVTGLISVISSIGGAIMAVLGVINAPLIVISGLIYGLITYWDEFKNALMYQIDFSQFDTLINIFNYVKFLFNAIWQVIKLIFGDLFTNLFSTNEKLNETSNKISLIGEVFKVLGATIGFVFNQAMSILNWFMSVLGGVMRGVVNLITLAMDNPRLAMEKLYNWLVNIFNKIKSIIATVKNIKLPNISGLATSAGNKIKSGWNSAKNWLGFGDKKETTNKTVNNTWNTQTLSTKRTDGALDININTSGNVQSVETKKRGFTNIRNISQ